jgi:hypothetical protein
VDLNLQLQRHQLSLMIATVDLTTGEKSAHPQFARDYPDQIRRTRGVMDARAALPGLVT